MPNTRQKSLRTSLNERAIAGKISSRSSTMIDGREGQHGAQVDQQRDHCQPQRNADDQSRDTVEGETDADSDAKPDDANQQCADPFQERRSRSTPTAGGEAVATLRRW